MGSSSNDGSDDDDNVKKKDFVSKTTALHVYHTFKYISLIRTLSKDDDDGSENVGKKMNLRSFKFDRVYLDPLKVSNAGDFSWS